MKHTRHEVPHEEDECDYCGNKYDSSSEGHEHFEDACECKYCLSGDKVKGKKFCSQECESNYVNS